VGSQTLAKGPPPKSDFYFDLDNGGSLYTDTAVEPLSNEGIEWWTDDDGVEWSLRRFHNAADRTYYFDVVLPTLPVNGTEYVVELNAGPDGFIFDGVLYEGLWAMAIAQGRTRWEWYYWGPGPEYRWRIPVVTWDPLEGHFLP
jgi:hypothetical protein